MCPKGSISFSQDNEGFFYPTVNLETCIDCHLCEKVCPYNSTSINRKPVKAFAFVHKDDKVHKNSSSGGAFYALASYFLNSNGIVYGAQFSKDFQVETTCVNKIEDLSKIMGSKYVQSNLNVTFTSIRAQLNAGEKVLFCGTPCQVKGLLSFLRKKYNNLYTVDFACHAIASPKVWEKYLSEVSNGRQISNVTFRDKEIDGWHNYALKISSIDKEQEVIDVAEGNHDNLFMEGFLSNLYCRPSCSKCPARNYSSGSDFTLADFWHVEKYHKDKIFNQNDGVSLLIDYGLDSNVVNILREHGSVSEVALSEIEDHNVHGCLTGRIKHHEMRWIFFKLIDIGMPVKTDISTCLKVKKILKKIIRR